MKRLIYTLAVALIFVACGTSNNELGLVSSADMAMETPIVETSAVARTVPLVERKIIREGDIDFLTADAAKTRLAILDAVSEVGGYISEDASNSYDGSLRHTMTLRVPAEKFDTLLAAVSSNASKIDHKQISAQDVTEAFIDVEARVKTKKELEARYMELLGRANTVTDVLEVERELGTLRADIESVEGQLKYLTDRVAMSSLTVTFYEKNEGGFGFARHIGEAVSTGWDMLLWVVVGLTHLWPFVVIGALVVLVVTVAHRKKRKS